MALFRFFILEKSQDPRLLHHHHHHASSALGQVPGTHLLHLSLSTAILFISTYPSLLFLPFFSLSSDSFFSTFSLQTPLLDHLSSPFLVYPSASSPPLSPPSHPSTNRPLPTHFPSNTSVVVLLF